MSHWSHTSGPYQRTDRPMTRVGTVCLIGLALLFVYSLAGCASPHAGAPPTVAATRPPVPTVEVPNPFFCPRPTT